MSVDAAPSRQPHRVFRWALLLAAVGLIIYLCVVILRPFVAVLVWSSLIAIAFYPAYAWLVARTRRPSLSALLCSLLVVVTIVIPLGLFTALAINQFAALREYITETLRGGFDPMAYPPVRVVADLLMRYVGIDITEIGDMIAQNASDLGRVVAEASLAAAANMTSAIVTFVFTVFATFFLFRDGARIVAAIPNFLPFERPKSEAVLLRIRDVIYASVYGVFVIAIVQGALIGMAFALAGIPSPAVWAVVAVFTSVIPMLGAGAVWVPGTIYLLLTGAWIQAIALAAFGGAVISSVDNFLRPQLVAGRVGLSQLAMFFAVLGGLQAFGLVGIIMGPVVFAVATSLFEVLAGTTTAAVPSAKVADSVPAVTPGPDEPAP